MLKLTSALKHPTKLILVILLCLSFAATSGGRQKSTPKTPQQPRQVAPSMLIRWQGRPGVERYRLQLATDAAFNDIVFDRAVTGRQYVVNELAPGKYFWRVAPAVGETGSFSRPAPVEMTSSTPNSVAVASVVVPADTGGWRTATGDVVRPVPANLRTGQVIDLVGVNRDGTIYAVDGVSGIALWTSRFRPDARRGEESGSDNKVATLSPIVLQTQGGGGADVLVAYDGGVRVLRGETGREVWRSKLDGRPTGGVATSEAAQKIFVVTEDKNRLYVLDAKTGAVIAEKSLDSEAFGAPCLLAAGEQAGVALGYKNGKIELRGADASVIREQKLDDELTTPPLAVVGQVPLLVVGTGNGLAALSLPDLKVLGKIASDDDVLRGTLSAADLDSDGSTEIIMVTKRGRVALVSTVNGNVMWYAEGAADAASVTFADLNADGVQDVIAAGGADFAVGFSGRDGSLIWKVEEGTGKHAVLSDANAAPRSLVIAPTVNGGGVVVGSDPARTGLRAVELPKGSIKTAMK
ncbi:MAG: PQQ-binding-like beta-propeller repeat protein [Pyrinomonadaceae bacterium]